MDYSVSAKGYLARARDALVGGSPEGLFYAAFELRCCIETRQAEYAEALSAYKGTKIRPWNIGDTGKRIRKASYADRIALMRYDFGKEKFESYHTPVPDRLLSFAEKELGNLLHCQTKYRSTNDQWWCDVRTQLTEGYRMAWLACQGDSLVPPLWDRKTGRVHPVVMEKNAGNAFLFERLPTLPGTEFKIEILYLTEAPSHWRCDI
jgi:hypothetical protein